MRFHLTHFERTTGVTVDLTAAGTGTQKLHKLSAKDSLIKVGMDALAISGTDVAPASDTVFVFQHGWCLAQIVTYDANGNPPFPGLTSGTDDFVSPVDANTVKLATSEANARAGTFVDITAASTGTHIFRPRAGCRTVNWYGGFSLGPGNAGVSLFARFLDPATATYPSAFRASITGMSIYDFANNRLVGGRAGGLTPTAVTRGFFDRNQIGAAGGPSGAVWWDDAVTLKSVQVAHGMTAVYDTETFADLRRTDAGLGGARLDGVTEGVRGLDLRALVTSGDTAKNAGANAAVVVQALRKNGNGVGAMGADQNLLAVRSASGVNRFILDADGNSHQDVGTAWTTFDLFDDVAVLNALAAHVTRADDPVRGSFRQWLEQPEYRHVLEKYQLVTFNEDGHHFVNMSRLTMLLSGAVRQVGERMQEIGTEVHRLGREIRALRGG